MIRLEFESLLRDLESKIEYDDCGYDVFDRIPQKYDWTYIKDGEIVGDGGRWTVEKRSIIKIEDKYYIAVDWNAPSTEMQEGQHTNCSINEVIPTERTEIYYKYV